MIKVSLRTKRRTVKSDNKIGNSISKVVGSIFIATDSLPMTEITGNFPFIVTLSI